MIHWKKFAIVWRRQRTNFNSIKELSLISKMGQGVNKEFMERNFKCRKNMNKIINKCKLIVQQRDPIFPIRLLGLKLW